MILKSKCLEKSSNQRPESKLQTLTFLFTWLTMFPYLGHCGLICVFTSRTRMAFFLEHSTALRTSNLKEASRTAEKISSKIRPHNWLLLENGILQKVCKLYWIIRRIFCPWGNLRAKTLIWKFRPLAISWDQHPLLQQ